MTHNPFNTTSLPNSFLAIMAIMEAVSNDSNHYIYGCLMKEWSTCSLPVMGILKILLCLLLLLFPVSYTRTGGGAKSPVLHITVVHLYVSHFMADYSVVFSKCGLHVNRTHQEKKICKNFQKKTELLLFSFATWKF